MSNQADGRNSRDMINGNVLVEFINRNVTAYPTEVSGPSFDLVPVAQQKDIMINVARMHARQEYNRIMELVAVLQRQATEVYKRLDITDLVHAAQRQRYAAGTGHCLIPHRGGTAGGRWLL